MKTLKTMVVREDIHVEDNDDEDIHLKTMECEDIASFIVSFSSFLSHRNHCTVKWDPSEQSEITEVMFNQILCLRAKTMRANLIQSWMSQLCL